MVSIKIGLQAASAPRLFVIREEKDIIKFQKHKIYIQNEEN
ncbi:MAG: hypothetical protein JWP44_380 [Mucilaginibacter sp.]|nr:hypothetical protein [Mucilaginibacter sp.]